MIMEKYMSHLWIALLVLAILAVGTIVAAVVKHVEHTSDKNAPTCGGYSAEYAPTDEDIALFSGVYNGDVELTPRTVSTQIVAGTNYRFRCVDADGAEYLVKIFVPLYCDQDEQQPRVTSVVKVCAD